MHPRMWKTETSLKKDIMKTLVKSLFCCFIFYGQIAFWPNELGCENACGKDAYGGNTGQSPGTAISASVRILSTHQDRPTLGVMFAHEPTCQCVRFCTGALHPVWKEIFKDRQYYSRKSTRYPLI